MKLIMGCNVSRTDFRQRSSTTMDISDIYVDKEFDSPNNNSSSNSSNQRSNQVYDETFIMKSITNGVCSPPSTGWVMKTKNRGNKKIFINICGHSSIPQSINVDNLFLLILKPEIMLVKGDECIVYDIILNNTDVMAFLVLQNEEFVNLCNTIVTQMNYRANLCLSISDISFPATKNNYKGSQVKPLSPERIFATTPATPGKMYN